MPSTDFVYVVIRNKESETYIPYYAGMGLTLRHALETAMGRTNQVEAWIQDYSDTRARFHVDVYDMSTTPPTLVDRPNLRLGGGPIYNA